MWGAVLGRHACAERLEAILEAGTAGLSVAVVEGAAGMGKTTLLERLLDGVEGRHLRRAGGRILQQRVPFGVLDELLDGWVSDAFDAGVDDPLTWTLRGADLLVDQITTTTTTHPAVLAVDDLQWADSVSLIALDRALPRLVHEPVCLLLALRPEGRTGEEVSALLDGIASHDATVVRLGPLSDEEATALVCELSPGRSDDEVAAIVRNGVGNPLYLRHLAAADPGQVSLGPVVASHLAGLPPDVASVVQVAAVGGTAIDASLAEAVTEGGIVPHLEVAAASGLVKEDGAGWRFEHDLVRDAVLDTIPGAEQDRIRHAFAAALAQRTDAHSMAEAATHLLAGGPPFTDPEIDVIARAARDAVHTDPGRAEELFGVLIDVLPETDSRHTEVLFGLRDAQHWIQGRTVGDDAASAMRRVWVLYLEGTFTAQDLCDAEAVVRTELEGDALDEALSVLAVIATSGRAPARTPQGRRLIDELTDREASLSESARIQLAAARVWLAFVSGALVRAAERSRELLALTEGRPATDEWRIWAVVAAGRMLIYFGETLGEGLELLATGARTAEKAGLPRPQLAIVSHLGAARYLWADWDEAQGLFSTALSMARDSRRMNGRMWEANARLWLLNIAIQQGDRAAVERLVPGPGNWNRWIRQEIGRERQLSGDHDEAGQILRAVALDRDAAPQLRTESLFLYAISAHLTDDDRGRQFVRSTARTIVGEGLQVQGVRRMALALANLDPDLALDEPDAQPPTVSLADRAEVVGLIHRALGDTDTAIEHFSFARDVWSKCGADARLARVDGWLRELGVRTRGRIDPDRPRIGWDAVTDAEMRVATLVGEGLTYQVIADRLFLSRRTVESHVASILRKLGLRNRGELAASYHRRQVQSSA